MRNYISDCTKKCLPKLGIAVLVYIGLFFSFAAHSTSKISDLNFDYNSDSIVNSASTVLNADEDFVLSKNTRTSVINPTDQFLERHTNEFNNSVEENKELEFVSIQHFVLIFKSNWQIDKVLIHSLEYHPAVSFGKLFILFHSLKIFS